MPALKAIHTIDPRREIMQRVGNLDWFRLRANQILCAVYLRPTEAALGESGVTLILTDGTKNEDRYQGKVGLIVKMGPTAFKDDETTTFYPEDRAKLLDWVVFRASDGWQLTLTGNGSTTKQLCRVFIESDIRAIIPSPDMVW